MDWSSVQEGLQRWGSLGVAIVALCTLYLRWSLARARLHALPKVAAEDTVPPRLTLSVELANRGHRRIVVHRYGLERPWFTVLGVDLPPWRGVFERDLKTNIVLEEAEQKEIPLLRTPQAALASARRIWFRDTHGKKWRRWRGRQYRKLAGPALVKRGTVDPLQERAFGEPGDQRSAHLALYPPSSDGKAYRIQLRMLDRGRYGLWLSDSRQSAEAAWPQMVQLAERYEKEGVDPTITSWGHPRHPGDVRRNVEGVRFVRAGQWEDRLPLGT